MPIEEAALICLIGIFSLVNMLNKVINDISNIVDWIFVYQAYHVTSGGVMNMHVTFIALFIFSIVVAFDVAYASTQRMYLKFETAKGASNREAVNVKPRANAKRAAATSRHSPESHAERRG
ncbi:hypothetical protein D917_07372 [Trichinella nativa]|uniref:Uncharacterized protein n=1 Tax=Trichinella nativa TaxID=6335 RepID=A0A1Y3ETM4_9BILA|nr:hypothetical protein D917_07372 [Trichinella nativa]